MFRKHTQIKQRDIFTNMESLLTGKSLDVFNDKNQWHHVFREQVFNKIDERIFSVLYHNKEGAPNSAVNVLISMMLLKEGFGWSDSELYDNCRFNILVRNALGLLDFRESVPCEASYYNFKRRIQLYLDKHSVDLVKKVYASITTEQVLHFKVDGRSVRMDSKLLGSNIARLSRFEMVHGVLEKFYKYLPEKKKSMLPEELSKKLGVIAKEEGEKIVYRSKDTEIADKLVDMGKILYQLVTLYKGESVPYYDLIAKVLAEQFNISEANVAPKHHEELKATNIQSAEDTDCDYRKKDEQEIFGGYSVNVTETCSESGLNLITVPEVKPASASDKDFYQSGVEQTESITQQSVIESFTDGAYHSQANKAYNEAKGIDMVLTGLQGREGRLSFEYQGNDLVIIDTKTGETVSSILTPQGKSYKIEIEGKKRYIRQQEIDSYFFRKEMEHIPIARRNRRNNVEATIFQVSYFTRNNKVRYRGLQKVTHWLYMRCLWINCVRIKNYLGETCPKSRNNVVNDVISSSKSFINHFLWFIIEKMNFQIEFSTFSLSRI